MQAAVLVYVAIDHLASGAAVIAAHELLNKPCSSLRMVLSALGEVATLLSAPGAEKLLQALRLLEASREDSNALSTVASHDFHAHDAHDASDIQPDSDVSKDAL